MSFVFPVMLGGLVLVGVPILLHLIMRQKPKHLLFPAFRFLLKRRRTNLRKLRLRHLLLLALRILLIMCICLALAQPGCIPGCRTLEDASKSLGLADDAKDEKTAAILIFD